MLESIQKYAKSHSIEISIQEQGESIYLFKLVIPKPRRKQGHGTWIMNELCKLADQHKRTIYLSITTQWGATSRNRLKHFYRRFGFMKNSDLSISQEMYRHNRKVSNDFSTKM